MEGRGGDRGEGKGISVSEVVWRLRGEREGGGGEGWRGRGGEGGWGEGEYTSGQDGPV